MNMNSLPKRGNNVLKFINMHIESIAFVFFFHSFICFLRHLGVKNFILWFVKLVRVAGLFVILNLLVFN